MSDSSLHNKTIRPGSLNGYSYYYSRRQAPQAAVAAAPAGSHKVRNVFMALALVIIGIFVAVKVLAAQQSPVSQSTTSNNSATSPQKQAAKAPAVIAQADKVNNCAGNTQPKLIKISISKRHLWACEANKTAYDTPVITGLQHHAETETPLGTYRVYGKQTNTTLKGSDSRGSWSDPVYYWMPFLDNQYGTYGFHDATWRTDSAFGKVSPDSEDASHGCIELPLASSKWLYDWTPVRTTVSVEA